jgi:hypothetical protein
MSAIIIASASILIIVILCAIALVFANTSITRRTLKAEIDIDASANDVWNVLLDFEAYPQWNPFIRQVTGKAEPGEKLTIQMHLGNRTMTISPTVLFKQQQRELRWLGNLLIPGIFDGEHSFVIDMLGEKKTHLTQSEKFSGLLIPFSKGILNKTKKSFNEMNQALKERAERID